MSSSRATASVAIAYASCLAPTDQNLAASKLDALPIQAWATSNVSGSSSSWEYIDQGISCPARRWTVSPQLDRGSCVMPIKGHGLMLSSCWQSVRPASHEIPSCAQLIESWPSMQVPVPQRRSSLSMSCQRRSIPRPPAGRFTFHVIARRSSELREGDSSGREPRRAWWPPRNVARQDRDGLRALLWFLDVALKMKSHLVPVKSVQKDIAKARNLGVGVA